MYLKEKMQDFNYNHYNYDFIDMNLYLCEEGFDLLNDLNRHIQDVSLDEIVT